MGHKSFFLNKNEIGTIFTNAQKNTQTYEVSPRDILKIIS